MRVSRRPCHQTFFLSDDLASDAISNMRFPLIVGVVMIHSKISSGDSVSFSLFQKVVSDLVPSPCVPLFFIISAFLFFWKIDDFDKSVYLRKLRSRWKSLVVPYIIWNSIAIVLFAAVHLSFPSLINPEFENIPRWKLSNYLAAFWNGSSGFPINYPLWFLRDLIVMVVLTPVFYYVVYKAGSVRWFCLILLGIAHFFIIHNGWMTSVFYFYIGTLLARERNGIYCRWSERKWRALWCTSTLFFFSLIIVVTFGNDSKALYNLLRFAGVVSYLLFFFYYSSKVKVVSKLQGYSFFIYLYHALFLLVSGRLLMALLSPNSFMSQTLVYLCNVLLVIVVGVISYNLLKKISAPILNIMTGSR